MIAAKSAAVITVTAAENPQFSLIAVSMAAASLAGLGRRHSNNTLPLLSKVRTLASLRSTNKARKSAMDTRLARPTLMPRSSAMHPLTTLSASHRHYRNAEFAIEDSAGGIVARARRIIFEHGSAIELKAAGRKPIAQHCGPGFLDLAHGALETQLGVFSAGYRGLLCDAERGLRRRRLASRIVSALLRRDHVRIIVADAIPWLLQQPARGHPRIDHLLPKRADGFAIG